MSETSNEDKIKLYDEMLKALKIWPPDEECFNLAKRVLSLYEDPHPGLHTWNNAVIDAYARLRTELQKSRKEL